MFSRFLSYMRGSTNSDLRSPLLINENNANNENKNRYDNVTVMFSGSTIPYLEEEKDDAKSLCVIETKDRPSQLKTGKKVKAGLSGLVLHESGLFFNNILPYLDSSEIIELSLMFKAMGSILFKNDKTLFEMIVLKSVLNRIDGNKEYHMTRLSHNSKKIDCCVMSLCCLFIICYVGTAVSMLIIVYAPIRIFKTNEALCWPRGHITLNNCNDIVDFFCEKELSGCIQMCLRDEKACYITRDLWITGLAMLPSAIGLFCVIGGLANCYTGLRDKVISTRSDSLKYDLPFSMEDYPILADLPIHDYDALQANYNRLYAEWLSKNGYKTWRENKTETKSLNNKRPFASLELNSMIQYTIENSSKLKILSASRNSFFVRQPVEVTIESTEEALGFQASQGVFNDI